MVRRFESRQSSDVLFIFIEILSGNIRKGGRYVIEVAEFIIGVIGRVVSGLFTIYIARLIDKFMHKNNRHE